MNSTIVQKRFPALSLYRALQPPCFVPQIICNLSHRSSSTMYSTCDVWFFQIAEVTLSGLDARVQHDSRGTRWHFPPRRRSFFAGLDSDTMKFVYGVLRQAQRHEDEQRQGTTDFQGEVDRLDADDSPDKCDTDGQDLCEAHPENQTVTAEEDAASHLKQEERRTVNMALVHEFAVRTESKQQERTLRLASCALREWSSATRKLRETRAKVYSRFGRRDEVRKIARQREFLVRLKKHCAAKKLARKAASAMLDGRRLDTARAVMIALATNLERGRHLDRSSEVLKEKLDASRTRREKSRAMKALIQARDDARDLKQKAEELHRDAVTRLMLEAFCGWAAAAGLSGRLRKRLGRADKALLENVISAWALFSKHSVEKRRRKEERAAQKIRLALDRAWDTEVLDEAFYSWAAITAAIKFHRIRLSARAFRGWAAVATASTTAAGTLSQLSSEKQRVLLAEARAKAEAKFERATRRRLADVFESWARGAGLASRLRRRLGRSEAALVQNAFSGWNMFARHSVRRREARLAAKATHRKNKDTLRAALGAWVSVTAADKFFRMRLSHQVFTAWRAVVDE